jgi:hypothetical protein
MVCRSAVVFALLLVLPAGASAQIGAPGDIGALVRQHLAAGEFGPAQRLAMGAADAATRNQILSQIALAQAAAGARRPSLGTAGLISDDLARTAALNGVAAQPVDRFFGRGGAALADFDSLITLIESTVQPDTWDTVGGPGAVEPFPGGVFVDGEGVLRKAMIEAGDARLSALRRSAAVASGNREAHRTSAMRRSRSRASSAKRRCGPPSACRPMRQCSRSPASRRFNTCSFIPRRGTS